ncbi:MAG: nitroreductase family protein [Saccharofermentanales bacterium]
MTQLNRTLELIQERSSIRSYLKDSVREDEIDRLKEAVLASPTARNRQQLRYSFIRDQELIRRMDQRIFHYCDGQMMESMKTRQADSFFYGAPLVVLISASESAWADLDAGIAVGILAIAAQSLGLSSVILGMPRLAFQEEDPQNCRALLDMEEEERFCVAIAIGRAAAGKEPHQANWDHIRVFD